MRRRSSLVGLAPVLLLSACNALSGTGNGTGTGATTDPTTGDRIISTPTSPPPSVTASPPPSSSSSEGTRLQTQHTSIGTVLTDGDGRVVYVYLRDTPDASRCLDACARAWPALTAAGGVAAGTGVRAPVGTAPGIGGTSQVTVAGRRLYTYSHDVEPGDTTGQAVGGVWFVVSPDGSPIRP